MKYNTADALRQILEDRTGSELSDRDNSSDYTYVSNNKEPSEDEDHVSAADEQHDVQLKRSDDEHGQANIASLSATVRCRGWRLGCRKQRGQ